MVRSNHVDQVKFDLNYVPCCRCTPPPGLDVFEARRRHGAFHQWNRFSTALVAFPATPLPMMPPAMPPTMPPTTTPTGPPNAPMDAPTSAPISAPASPPARLAASFTAVLARSCGGAL